MSGVAFRRLRPDDFDQIVAVVDDWWERPVRDKLPRLFFEHFWSTSFIAEDRGALVGFIIGFLSPSQPTAAYVHFVGVDPRYRGRGIGTELYERFFAIARQHHRTEVQAITSPSNVGSLEFHRRLGFTIRPGDRQEAGVSVHGSYEPSGDGRVIFVQSLGSRGVDPVRFLSGSAYDEAS